MASHMIVSFGLIACTLFLITSNSSAQLTTDFYSKSCPDVFKVVRSVVFNVVSRERRMGGSLLRLHYHDCMVHGCDGSLLLDDTPTFKGEKTAAPNYNSARGFEVVDLIKAKVEKVCPGVVSCADILAIAAHASVSALGGPFWYVKLGRRDSKTASFTAANSGVIPPESSSLNYLIKSFQAVGLSVKDMVALSGAHTLGQARCVTFRPHVYNGTNIDPLFAIKQQSYCPFPAGKGDNNLVPLDIRSPYYFDTYYYYNLINKQGLLHSDQQYYSGGMTDAYVYGYYKNPKSFFVDFAAAIIKMGDISPLTGHQGEIRKNCRVVNS